MQTLVMTQPRFILLLKNIEFCFQIFINKEKFIFPIIKALVIKILSIGDK